jgi:hypothetical protein
MSDLPGLQAFVAVARLGHVGRAAASLGLSQPSVSARLARLEAAWGTRLFRRHARMALTPRAGCRWPRWSAPRTPWTRQRARRSAGHGSFVWGRGMRWAGSSCRGPSRA